MWSIGQLKQKAKFAFKANYWKTVIVTLLLVLILGGGSAGSSASTMTSSMKQNNTIYGNSMTPYGGDSVITSQSAAMFQYVIARAWLVAIIVIAVIIAIVIAILLKVFIGNPVLMGASRFYYKNLHKQAEIKEVGYGFDRSYRNVVKIMFFKDLYTFLWSLLFIVPGVVKSYEYKMIPFILAEHPDLPMDQVFSLSRQMTDGYKGKAFLLDLSFIGWEILSVCSGGIVGIFYVDPYLSQTHAALYEQLAYAPRTNPDETLYTEETQQNGGQTTEAMTDQPYYGNSNPYQGATDTETTESAESAENTENNHTQEEEDTEL